MFIYFVFFKEKKVYMRGISTRCGGARETFVYFSLALPSLEKSVVDPDQLASESI